MGFYLTNMYIMKLTTNLIVLILAFLFVCFMSLGWSVSNFTPFAFSSSRLHEYPYEGFHNRYEYTTYPANQSIDSYDSKLIVPAAEVKDSVKLRGFDGLAVSANSADTPIDTYSQALGETNCKSYGLTNSRGFLCLTPEQIQKLTTRGGNMSSGEAIIG